MIDRSGGGAGEPAVAGFSITPSDASELPFMPRAIYVGGAGHIAAMMLNGDIAVFANTVAGSILGIRVRKVYATGTTASGLVGLY